MEHLHALFQFIVPGLIALNIWLLRQGFLSLKNIFHQNEQAHEAFRAEIRAQEQRLTRAETRIEQVSHELSFMRGRGE